MLTRYRQMPVEAFASIALAWMTNGKERKKGFGGETPTDARLFCRAVRARPRLKRGGTQPQAMLPGTRPLRLTGFPRPCLSQSSECTSRPGPSAEGLMPKAARERVASPRAGTALARTAWNASQAASEKGEVRNCK
jgi:hypothetical protein